MLALVERFWLKLRQFSEKSSIQRYEAVKNRLLLSQIMHLSRFRTNLQIYRLYQFEQQNHMKLAYGARWQRLAARCGWLSEPKVRLNNDPLKLIGMAQNPLSTKAIARALAQERAAPLLEIDERINARADYAAAFLVATAMTGDDVAIDHARARIHDVANEAFLQIVESYGQRPTDHSTEIEPLLRGLRRSGLRARKQHRLVIAENLQDPETFLPLLRGAKRITLLGLDDTFGRAVFDKYRDYPDVGEIVVEHIRSRITRFSPQYVDVHSQTRDAAIELAAICDSVPGLVPLGDLPHLELAIADHLFFQVLRLRAIEELLSDPSFDHIVVATNNHDPKSGYILTLSGVESLTRDPRVELISLARTFSQRMKFAELLPAILTGPQPMVVAEAWLPPASKLAAQLWRSSRIMSSSLPDRAVPQRKKPIATEAAASILVVATSNLAYNLSTARYAAALSQNFSTAFAVCGGAASDIQRELSKAGVAPGRIPFRLLRREYLLPSTSAFARWLTGQLNLFCARRGSQDKIAHVIACAPEHSISKVIQSQIMHGQVLDTWFSRMTKADGLPDAIVLSAARAPAVSQFMAAARRYGVPTLLLEAHGLNANYCRYTKVGADYYGVISERFRADAAQGFAISAERIEVLGTPRIVAAPGRNRDLARAEIAEDLGHDFPLRAGGVVSFFSQPSNWIHVAEVWRLVLAAAQELNLQVLLKPHPEETSSRIMQYGAIANHLRAEDQVQLINSSPNLLIEASDVVLTGYSAAALDAAVMGRPVVCVTVGNATYPVDQHEIARAPLVSDLPGLCAALAERLKIQGDEAYTAFLAAEPQFAEGPNGSLCDFMAKILSSPAIRPLENLPKHLFLDPPHPTFTI